MKKLFIEWQHKIQSFDVLELDVEILSQAPWEKRVEHEHCYLVTTDGKYKGQKVYWHSLYDDLKEVEYALQNVYLKSHYLKLLSGFLCLLKIGSLAHLGERCVCTAEVTGS